VSANTALATAGAAVGTPGSPTFHLRLDGSGIHADAAVDGRHHPVHANRRTGERHLGHRRHEAPERRVHGQAAGPAPALGEGRPALFRYCLSYTATLFTVFPAAFTPFVVTVRVLPSADTVDC